MQEMFTAADFPSLTANTSNTTNPSTYEPDQSGPSTSTYDKFVLYASLTISFISFLGALFIMITYIKFPKLRNFTFKLVSFISFSDFIFYFGKLLTILQMSGVSNQFICHLQGLTLNFGELASVLWSGAFAFTIYNTFVKSTPNFHKRYDLRLKLFAFGIPFLVTLTLWLCGYIGNSGEYCWVVVYNRSRWKNFYVRILTFYLPLWIVIYYVIFVYLKFMHYLGSIEANVGIRRLALYPLVLVFCWFFPTLHRIESFFNSDTKLLNAMHNICESLQGILNSIIYGMSENVRYEWKKYLIMSNWCLCLFADAERFKNNIECMEFEHYSSFLGSDSNRSSLEVSGARNNPKDIELQENFKGGVRK